MTHCEWSRRVTCLCAALALAATPAAAQTPAAQTPAAQTPAAAPAPRQLSLDEALGLAEPVSDDIAIARAGLARAEGQRIRARSTFFPQLIGSASYIRTIKTQYSSFVSADTGKTAAQCNSFVPDSTLPIDQRVRLLERALGCSTGNVLSGLSDLPFGRPNNWNLGLSASWTVFAGGRNRANVQAATATKAGAEVALTAARAQVMLDITQAYYDAALSDRQVGIAVATLAQAETTFTQVKLARQVGNSPEFDQLRAQVTRDNQRPVLIQRQTDREIAYQRLKQLLNLPLDQPLVLTTDLNDSTAQPGSRLASLVSQAPDTAVDERAPVRQARQSVRASDESYTAAHAQRFPAITLSSAYGRVAYPSSAFPSWGSFLDNWTVTAGLQVPIFVGGQIKGDEEIARANQEEARARLSQTRKLAALDVRTALARLQAAQASWEASAGTSEQATRAYTIAQVRYREGISTQTELSDSRLQLEQSQVNRAQAARDLQVARIRLALIRDLPLSGVSASSTSPAGGANGQQAPAQPQSTPSTPPAQPGTQPPGTVTAANALGVTP